MKTVNGVYVDPAELSKAAKEVEDIAEFCGTEDKQGKMDLPGRETSFENQIAGLELAYTLPGLDDNWKKKCLDLGGDFKKYRDNLEFYCYELLDEDYSNAKGLEYSDMPGWMDDVPDSQENEK